MIALASFNHFCCVSLHLSSLEILANEKMPLCNLLIDLQSSLVLVNELVRSFTYLDASIHIFLILVISLFLLILQNFNADDKVGLKLNIEKAKLGEIIEQMPALRRPTVSSLTDDSWVAIETVIEKKVSRELIPALKRRGAEGIVEYPLNKIVP